MRPAVRHPVAGSLTIMALAVVIGGCSAPLPSAPAMNAAVGGNGPTVQSVDPPFGYDATASKTVTILGSGYAQGAVASWERNGAADPKIAVLSTTYVNSTTLTAVISIAPDATLGFYDVAVTSGGRKGIGASKFEVTQALAIQGTEIGYGILAGGETVGRTGAPGGFYFDPSSGRVDTLGRPGRAYAISNDGLSIAGGDGGTGSTTAAWVFQRVAGTWQPSLLPKSLDWANARALASDPSTGAAAVIAGVEGVTASQKQLKFVPLLWTPAGAGWTRVPLPRSSSGDDNVMDVTAASLAVGATNAGSSTIRAAAWEPNGSGGWTLVNLGPAGSKVTAVKSDGTVAVGYSGGAAAYWLHPGPGTWTGPMSLPGKCTSADDIDDLGRIAANGCANGSKLSAAVLSAPSATATVYFLGGLGDAATTNTVTSISPSGGWLTGQATLKGTGVAVRWHIN